MASRMKKKQLRLLRLVVVIGLLIFIAIATLAPFKSTLLKRLYPKDSSLAASLPTSYSPKVLLLIYNPILEDEGSKKLTQYAGWNDPDQQAQQLVNDIKTASHNFVNYQIVQRVEIDGYPVKEDGFQYSDTTYLQCLHSSGANCHNPDLASYISMINAVDACGKRNRGEIDELWITGGPWFGYWESNLAGPSDKAFWYNSSPTLGTTCQKLLPVMGFNYQVGEDNMIHDFGHRLESVMTKVYGYWSPDQSTAWNRFSLLNKDMPGKGGCGNTHFPVNGQSDYDYGNTNSVTSSCADYSNYPNLTGATAVVNCNTWGCNQRGYLMWMFGNLPHADGLSSDGKLANWWRYIVDADNTIYPPTPQFSGLNATLTDTKASFFFTDSGLSPQYHIDVSTTMNFTGSTKNDFGLGNSSPIEVSSPTSVWSAYSCGMTIYWQVSNSNRSMKSPIQTASVVCPATKPPPTPTPNPTSTPTKTPKPIRIRTPRPVPSSTPTIPISTPPSGGGSGTLNNADLNGDGKVNVLDMAILMRNFGRGGQGDLNSDGKVDISDLSTLVSRMSLR